MDEDEAFEAAEEAAAAAGRLNEIMDVRRGTLSLDGGTRAQLLDLISRTAGDLSGCISRLGEGPGADIVMGPTLARAAQQVWDAVRGLQPTLLHPRPWPDRGDPEALIRADLAEAGWAAGQQHGRAGETPYQAGARSPRGYLERIVRGDAAGEVLDGAGLGKWAADPAAADVVIAAYCESYAAAAGLALPGSEWLAGIRYLPGQQVTGIWGRTDVLDGGAAPGGSPLASTSEGPAALFHRAAIRAPLALEFPTAEAARDVLGAMAAQGRSYPVADGDVLVVPGAGAWLACGAGMVPASSFAGGGGRYADSIRLAREAAPQQAAITAGHPAAAVAGLGFTGRPGPGHRLPGTRAAATATPPPPASRQGPAS